MGLGSGLKARGAVPYLEYHCSSSIEGDCAAWRVGAGLKQRERPSPPEGRIKSLTMREGKLGADSIDPSPPIGQPLRGPLGEIAIQAILEALPEAVYTTDADGRITFFNSAAVALWGVVPEVGKSTFCGSWKLYWPDATPLPHSECPMAWR